MNEPEVIVSYEQSIVETEERDVAVIDREIVTVVSEGIQGPSGVDGADGEDGSDGQSAYEMAVANGFVGTEEDWLASLVGEQGEQGEPGQATFLQMTQAEYDALPSPDPEILYVIIG